LKNRWMVLSSISVLHSFVHRLLFAGRLNDTGGKDRRIWEPYALNAHGSHMCGSWNKCVNHVCCTFVFGGETKAKTKMQQRSLTPLFYNLRICEPYAFNAYGFHMRWFLPPVHESGFSAAKCKLENGLESKAYDATARYRRL
jgi:hypothetical protein